MNKKKMIGICVMIFVAVVIAVCIAIVQFPKKDLEAIQKEYKKIVEKYGVVEKETVSTMIAKFNTEIMDSGLNTPAYDDYMTIENDVYWFGLTENISYYLQPVEFTGDKEKDIVEMTAIYFKKESYDEKVAYDYASKLIKANNHDLTEEEIDKLMKEAKDKSTEKMTSNNGKGISVGFLEYDDNYIYQVIRLYQ